MISTGIKRLEVYALRGPKIAPSRQPWTAHFPVPAGNEILVRLHTQGGKMGFGMASSYTDIQPLIHPWRTGFADLIVGEDAACPEKLVKKLFTDLSTSRLATSKGWSREALTRLSAAVDVACWDIIGQEAGLPLYKLFGGSRDEVDAYGTCGYYRGGDGAEATWDRQDLRDELQMMLDQGHRAVKIKTGGLALDADMERLCFIRDVIGRDVDLMVDVNRAWDLETALAGVKLLKSLDIRPRWLEEPVRWQDDRRMLQVLKQNTDIPLSGGESESTSWGCRAMIEEKAISICQFDVTMLAGGFTEGRKIAALCELNHVQVAPHHDCFIHAHLVAGCPNGLIVEAFTDPERDPLQAELFENPPAIVGGKLKLSDQPGLGLKVSERALEKFGERIV